MGLSRRKIERTVIFIFGFRIIYGTTFGSKNNFQKNQSQTPLHTLDRAQNSNQWERNVGNQPAFPPAHLRGEGFFVHKKTTPKRRCFL
jgi:hypothetical protein